MGDENKLSHDGVHRDQTDEYLSHNHLHPDLETPKTNNSSQGTRIMLVLL